MKDETIDFLKDKTLTISFRLKIEEIDKLFSGQEMEVTIKGKKFTFL